jgi:peptidoglycan/LPS O-acetylase OafA/YrhL
MAVDLHSDATLGGILAALHRRISMSEPSEAGARGPWRRLMLAVIALLLIILGVAFWSEEEDLENLPAEEIESSESGAGAAN